MELTLDLNKRYTYAETDGGTCKRAATQQTMKVASLKSIFCGKF
jgi:hypothetical protein